MMKLSKNDFEYTFESQGTSFIFEDLVDEFYDPINTLSFFENTIKNCYISNQTDESRGNGYVSFKTL